MGDTELSMECVAVLLHDTVRDWNSHSYHLIARNCASFAAFLCEGLQVQSVPRWVIGVAKVLRSPVWAPVCGVEQTGGTPRHQQF